METLIYDIGSFLTILSASMLFTWLACISWDRPSAAWKDKPIVYVSRRNWAREYLENRRRGK